MSESDAGAIVRRISELVDKSVPEWVTGATVASVEPEMIVRPWSFMFRYPLTNHAHAGAVLVKVARHKDMELPEAVADKALLYRTEKEFEMLSTIAQIFGDMDGTNEFCFVQPLEILPEWNALAMEELDARVLKDYFLKPYMVIGAHKDWDKVTTLLKRSASWLRQYHHGAENGVDVQSLNDSGLRARIENTFTRLEALLSRKWLTFKASMLSWCDDLGERPVPMAMLHSDFHCGNILVTPDYRVGALDADMVRGPVYLDLAKCYADLKTRSVQVLTFGNFIRRRQLENCYRAIVQGYFGADNFDEELLKFFVSIAILEKWMFDEEAIPQFSGAKAILFKLLSKWRRTYFLHMMRRQLA